MEKIALSIEELIYCFYTEGLFEQGNGLKQVYLDGITDEQLDLALQIVCRTLMSKGFVRYVDHKFVLRPDVSDIMSSLNYPERTVRASKHNGGSEEAVSFHVSGERVYRHDVQFDGQVHVFEKVDFAEIGRTVCSLFGLQTAGADGTKRFTLSREQFEELLGDGSEEAWNRYDEACPAERKSFNRMLKDAGGLLNTLLFMEFNNDREPSVQDVALFPNHPQENWLVLKEGDTFVISECDDAMINRFIRDRLSGEEARIGT